jgi:hypothetical protein
MLPIRFRLRTIMIVIGSLAVLMGILKNAPYWLDGSGSAPAVFILVVAMMIIVARKTITRSGERDRSGE